MTVALSLSSAKIYEMQNLNFVIAQDLTPPIDVTKDVIPEVRES